MVWCDGVESFFGFGVDVGGNHPAEKDYVVAGYGLGFEGAFEVGDGVREQKGINFLSGLGFAIRIGEFVGVAAGPRAEKEGDIGHISRGEGDGETFRMADGLGGIMRGGDGDSHHGWRAGGNHCPAERNGVRLTVFVFCYGDNELFGVFCFYGL